MDLLNLIASLNDSKIFSGIIMIAMNLGSKYISMELNETQEDFLNTKTIRRIIIFINTLFINTKFHQKHLNHSYIKPQPFV